MTPVLHLLVVDDNPNDRLLVSRELEREFPDAAITQINNPSDLAVHLDRGGFDLVITDYELRWAQGLSVLQKVKHHCPDCPVIMFTGTGNEEVAVEAMKNGLDDYIVKSPKHLIRLRSSVRSCLEKKRLIDSERETHRILGTLLDNLPGVLYRCRFDRPRSLDFVSAGCKTLFGLSPEELLAKTASLQHWIPSEEQDSVWEKIEACLSSHPNYTVEYRIKTASGETRWILDNGMRISDSQTHPVLLEGLLLDITERKEAEEQRRNSQILLEKAQHVAHLGYWQGDIEKDCITWSDEVYAIFGRSSSSFDGRLETFFSFVYPEDREAVREASRRSLQDKAPFRLEHRIVRPDGDIRWVEEQAEIIRDDTGKPLQMIGTVQDITERRRLHNQFLQAQKMESVGLLAGGIAHDFNNLLMVIQWYCQSILDTLRPEDPLRQEVTEIEKAGERAATLTRQLLTFSRKQIVHPQTVHLNQVILNLEKMLRRLISEDIEMSLFLAPQLHPIKADPGQLEQVIVNLVINAKDAMPHGGSLSIHTENDVRPMERDPLEAGSPPSYVRLSVQDNGCGMSDNVKSRVFEPFFSTKEEGKGTGLGLSTVYGIVKQCDGFVEVDSRIDRGTVFRIYFPACAESVETPSEKSFPSLLAGSEVILLVEDNDMVRTLAVRILKKHGYTLLEASNGIEALNRFRQEHERIDLVITDVVMPLMSGRELSEQIRRHKPEQKILFMSGYTDDVILRHGILDEGIQLLHKPYSPDALLKKVREILSPVSR